MRVSLVMLLAIFAFPARADKTLVEWRFDRHSVDVQWNSNQDVTERLETDSHLEFKCAGFDPVMECLEPFEFAASPWQAIEVTLKADHDGEAEIFWSGTREGRYGGFSGEKSSRFMVRGDNEWRTYRVYPFWQKEKRIMRLRFDPYDGTRFELGSIKIIQQDPGLNGSLSNGVETASGTLTQKSPDGFEMVPASADAALNPVVAVKLSTENLRRASLLFATDSGYGMHEYSFELIPDGKPHVYNLDMLNAPDWQGNVVALGIRPGERAGDKVRLEWMKASRKALGAPEPRITALSIEEALPRAGTTVAFHAMLTNAGGEMAGNIKLSLRLPKGVVLKGSPGVKPRNLAYGQEAEWKWNLIFGKPGKYKIEVAVSALGCRTFTASSVETVTPRLIPPGGKLPPVKPVKTSIDIGVYYFPGWKSASQWAPIRRFPERRPVLGWYKEGDPDVADWQIRWAVEHGITFFAYDWYWTQGARSLEHAIDDGLFHAKNGKLLKFCLLWANHNPENTSSLEDCVKATQYWIKNYFRRPEYYTIDGKPVVIIFSTYRFRADLGSDGVKKTYEAMREECRKAGLKGLYLLACVGGDLSECKLAEKEGYDAVTAYNWPALGVKGSEKWAPYSDLIVAYKRLWQTLVEQSPLPLMTPLSGGWDSRPWHGEAALVRYGRTPALFKKHLEDAKAFIKSNPGKTLPIARIEAWNELGEGSYIEPVKEFGFGYLDAIREVFSSAPAAHRDYTPADVNQKVPQVAFNLMTRSSWKFAKSTEGWDSTMNGTSPKTQNNELVFESIGDDVAIFGPPVQINATDYSSLHLRMSLLADSGVPFDETGQIFWSTRSSPTSEASSVHFPIRADGKLHDMDIPLNRNLRWRDIITGLRLDPCNRTGVKISIAEIKLVK